MKITIRNLDDINHTRLIKWMGNHLFADSYNIKKVGTPSADEYLITLDPEINSSALITYLNYRNFDFIQENKTAKLRQIIKEEIQKSLNETSIRPEVLDMFEGSCNERNLAAFKKLLESLCKEWAGPSGGYFDEDDIVEYISYLVSQHRDIWD